MKFRNKKQQKLWSLFVDLKSAFDTVNHEILFEKMRKYNIDEKLTDTIEWLYRQTKIKTKYQEIKLGTGVIQGGVISPSLFLIMFDDLLAKLDELGYQVYAYADDLSIIQKGREKLDIAIQIIENEQRKTTWK